MSKPIARLRQKFSGRRGWIVLAMLLLLVVAAFFWHDIYAFVRYRDDSQREAVNLTYRIGKTVLLPSDEIPGLATVTDSTKLNRGGVLTGAQNGDKVLLFYKGGRVVLYRPSVGKVVAVGPMVLDASAAQVKGTRIVIRNGSGNDVAVSSAIALMKERYSEATISGPESASRVDYPTSIAIDLTEDGSKTQFVGAITELLGVQKGILPSGESKPADADILIIIGKDFK